MKKNNIENIDNLFKRLEDDFDTESPILGHQQRFLEKLEQSKENAPVKSKSRTIWKPILAVAASIIICFGLFATFNQEKELEGLASVSTELMETQSFFSSAIETELILLKAKRSPQTNMLIDDALAQMALLEADYKKLKTDLSQSGNDRRVVYAMIANFQSRIDLLETVMETIEHTSKFNRELTHQI